MPNMFEPLDPIGPALNAFNATEGAIANRSRNALTQMAMQKEKQRQNALKQYGQTKDMDALWKADPETAMAAEKFVSGMRADKRETLAQNIKIWDAMKGAAVKDSDVYESMYNQADADFQKYLMKPDKFAKLSPEERGQELFQKERLAMAIKQAPSWYQQKRIQIDEENQKYKETPTEKESRAQNRHGTVLRFDNRGIPVAYGTTGPTKVANEPAGATFVNPQDIKPGQKYPPGTKVRPAGKEGDSLWGKAVDRADAQIKELLKEESPDRRLRKGKDESDDQYAARVESFRQELAQKYYNEVKAGPGGGGVARGGTPTSQPKPQALTKEQEDYYQQHLKSGDIDPEVLKAKRDELLKKIGQ